MKIKKYPETEPNTKAWFWRLLLGPASILDGIIETITLSRYSLSAKYTVSLNLAKARFYKGGES